ncbi:stimulator of interferon genes protein-like [Pieris napi]|uniref:stimulator of interferon genes protein-like n=1 Tax=Pieris napi TaxID=78633 RepID=UPI001FB8B1AE|nr:stimulator of interferon genes protein-like [Pieris napi]
MSDLNFWIINTAHYLFYLQIIHTMYNLNLSECVKTRHKYFFKILSDNRKKIILFGASLAILLYNDRKLFDQHFVVILIAYFIMKYEKLEKSTINYGVGMACSFYEGYLAQIIPSNGADFIGFEENIRNYENCQGGVVFPVKKLFIVITKSLYCPPDLKEFNKKDPSLPYLEACQSLGDVQKDQAGVKNRIYRNSAYKIHRAGTDPVYLAVECATPLHTLHKVLKNRTIYEELGSINAEEVVSDFCETLGTIIRKTPECRGKCELVYYDDEDPNQNLAEILLDRIETLRNLRL